MNTPRLALYALLAFTASVAQLTAQTTNTPSTTGPSGAGTGGGATTPGTASSTPATSSPSTVSAPAGATMSTVVVTGVDPTNVLPTTVGSVFGTDMSLQDTPRAVTQLTPQLLQSYDIHNLQGLSIASPSAYMTDQFGGYAVPNIRGQSADVFVNGMERITRTDGPPTSFNSIESANVVAGPASSVYGPSQYVGGYVDFITKQPYFDAFHSDTEMTYGMYDTKRWTEDFGGPITKDLAYRVSYTGEDSGSYFDNIITHSQNGFAALAWVPSQDFRVDANASIEDTRFNEESGFNRPTQDLISQHNYLQGPYVNEFFAPPNFAAGYVAATGESHISDSAQDITPSDSDYGKNINGELKETYKVNDDLTFINTSYAENEHLRNSEYAQYYANLIDTTWIEDRAEAHYTFDIPIGGGAPEKSDGKDMKDMKDVKLSDPDLDIKNEIVTGMSVKAIDVTSYQGYYNEYLNASDLSVVQGTGAPNWPSYNLGIEGGGYAIPGTNLLGQSAYDETLPFGAHDTGSLREEGYDSAAFFQDSITFTPQWSMLVGTRMDVITDGLSDVLDPDPVHQSTSAVLPSANVSVDYKPAPWITTYATFSYSQSTIGNDGGGFAVLTPGGAESSLYHFPNFLYEGGAKLNLLNNTLFLTGAGYFQTHTAVTSNAGGTNATQVRVIGGELQQIYQPDKHLFMTFNENYMQATLVDPANEITESTADITEPSPGTPNFTAPPPGHYRESGLPQMQFSGLVSYTLDSGFGASMDYTITDPIPVTELNPAWIPWQYQIDATLFYKAHNWEATLHLMNITDQHNWSTGGYIAGSGADLITISEPFHMEGTVGYKF